MTLKNLLFDLPQTLPHEHFDALITRDDFRVERIISDGHTSPDGFWYDQAEEETVILLQGEAVIEYEDGRLITLKAGDMLTLKAHEKHRVASTSKHEKTIWLALFYPPKTPLPSIEKEEWTQEEFLQYANTHDNIFLIDTIANPIKGVQTTLYNPYELLKLPEGSVFVFYCDTGKSTKERLAEYRKRFPSHHCISLRGGRGYWKKTHRLA